MCIRDRRVSEEEEIVGLDSCEHGLPSAYAGFSIMDISNTMTMEVNENTSLGAVSYTHLDVYKRQILPAVLIFFCLQRYLVEGISTSGLKG